MAYYNNYMTPNQWQHPNNYVTQTQQSNDERIWVTGRNSAEAYLVAPNSFVRLWDSQSPVYYEKRTDATGRPFPIDVFEYKRITNAQPLQAVEGANYQEQIKNLEMRIIEIEKGMRKHDEQSNANDTAV